MREPTSQVTLLGRLCVTAPAEEVCQEWLYHVAFQPRRLRTGQEPLQHYYVLYALHQHFQPEGWGQALWLFLRVPLTLPLLDSLRTPRDHLYYGILNPHWYGVCLRWWMLVGCTRGLGFSVRLSEGSLRSGQEDSDKAPKEDALKILKAVKGAILSYC